MRYIIIGNGVAGDSAALGIREIDKDSEILIFTDEEIPFYYRPRLIDVIAGEILLERIIIHNQDYYKKQNIEIHLSTRIEEIDFDNNKIKTKNNESYQFDKLILATGAHSFIPPITGSDKSGVFSLRNAADSLEIIKFQEKISHAIIIGGGLLGLETANAFLKRGKNVSIIEFFERLLPRQLDEEGAAILQKQLEDKGFKFYLSEVTEEIYGEDNVKGIKTKSGKNIPGEMIVISAGIRSNIELVKDSQVRIERAIAVDKKLQTSLSDVFAVGDCAEIDGRFYGIYPPAMEQGKISGHVAAGKEEEYPGSTFSHKLKVVGIDLMSMGKLDMEGKMTAVSVKDETNFLYKKAFLEDGIIVGTMLLGDLSGADEIEKAIKEGLEFETISKYFKE